MQRYKEELLEGQIKREIQQAIDQSPSPLLMVFKRLFYLGSSNLSLAELTGIQNDFRNALKELRRATLEVIQGSANEPNMTEMSILETPTQEGIKEVG